MNNISLGTIVIGRNEGERLRRALKSIPRGAATVLYVDSGSSDGSVALARSMGIDVHELDPEKPFSAARARREGVEVMLKDHPALNFIQFLDGDCALEKGWSEKAIAHLSAHPDTAIVCGLLTEANPGRSIYNRFIAIRWNAMIGDIDACGGIFMIRICVYKSVGGFNAALLTGEESELCARVTKAGHRIVRLEAKMACHDADLVSFSQWCGRAVWGGFGDAMQYDVLKGGVSAARRRETRSIVIWAVAAPLLGLLGAIGAYWLPWLIGLPLACALAYLALVVRVGIDRLRRGDAVADASLYAFFCVLRKFPSAIGFFKYRLFPSSRAKVPDPHAPVESVHREHVSQ